jgi:hypothetical protein
VPMMAAMSAVHLTKIRCAARLEVPDAVDRRGLSLKPGERSALRSPPYVTIRINRFHAPGSQALVSLFSCQLVEGIGSAVSSVLDLISQ